MIEKIHILGASGSGTTTLAKLIEKEFGYKHLDTDDFFWEKTDPPFQVKRSELERVNLILIEFESTEKVVLSGSLCSWGNKLIPYFDLVIELNISCETRIERIQKREFERFGNRILEGGDMYKQHFDFIEWAKSFDTGTEDHRSRKQHDKWLEKIECKKLVFTDYDSIDCVIAEIGNLIQDD